MKRTIFKASAIAVASITVLHAAPAFATNGMNPHCVGTQSCGMGGVGISMGTGATSVSLNPAMMAKEENAIDINLGWFHADRSMDAQSDTGSAAVNEVGRQDSKNPDFPNGSLGVNYRLNSEWSFGAALFPGGGGATSYTSGRTAAGGNGGYDNDVRVRYMLASAGVAWQPNSTLSIGFAPVIGRVDVRTDFATLPAFARAAANNNIDTAYGTGFRLGMSYDLNDKATLAATYRSPIYFSRLDEYKDVFSGPLNLPMEGGVGLTFDANPNNTIAIEGKFMAWQTVHAIADAPGEGGFGWKNVPVISLGWQHKWDENLKLRLGYNYGESPLPDNVIFANALFPAIVQHHFTAGGEYKWSDSISLGLSAYYAPWAGQTDDGSGDSFSQMGQGTSINHRQYGAQASLSWKF